MKKFVILITIAMIFTSCYFNKDFTSKDISKYEQAKDVLIKNKSNIEQIFKINNEVKSLSKKDLKLLQGKLSENDFEIIYQLFNRKLVSKGNNSIIFHKNGEIQFVRISGRRIISFTNNVKYISESIFYSPIDSSKFYVCDETSIYPINKIWYAKVDREFK